MMDENVNNQCLDLKEKLSFNLVDFEKMLEITQQLKLKSLDTELELCNKMIEQRQDLINKIEKIYEEVFLIQNNLIQKINLKEFNIKSLQPYISNDLYESLATLYAKMQDVIRQIQALDKEYNNNVEMQKEATKLQLLRVQSNLRPNQSYKKVRVPESRFIDKNR